MTQRKHAALIKAWADGARIERLVGSGIWQIDTHPSFAEHESYRLAADRVRYRVAAMRSVGHAVYTVTVNDGARAKSIEKSPTFVRWLTDWIETTVDEPKQLEIA